MSARWFRIAPSFLLVVVVHFTAFSILTNTAKAQNSIGAVSDRLALLAIKSMIRDDPQGLMTSWNDSNTNFCQWQGVACGRRHQRVTFLDLSSGGLTGMLSPSIGNLSFLKMLLLYNNSFSGDIPPEIGRLFRLQQLGLYNNFFTGNIPITIGNCSNLQVLVLSNNNLVGKIPDAIGSLSMLRALILHRNNLEGGIPMFIANLTLLDTLSLSNCTLGGRFPDVFHQLSNLKRLAFAGNNLVGTIPPSFYNCSSLEQVFLDNNQLTGRLPTNLGSIMPRLALLYLSNNRLTGPLPPSLLGSPQLYDLDVEDNYLSGKLVTTFNNSCNLEFLYLDGNSFGSEEDDEMKFIDDLSICRKLQKLYLHYNQFKGFLPESIGNLPTTLDSLSVAFNYFSGDLPSSIGNLTGLALLDLSSNQFTGTLPVTIGNLTNLQRLDLTNNTFSGNIPGSLGNLSLMIELYLTSNEFTGTIPSSLGNCKKLIRLNLDQNNLTGEIPRQLFEISSLSISLNLGDNQLSGQLPVEVGNLKNLNEMILANNRLTGSIPSSLGSCSSLQNLDISFNLFSGSFPSSLGSLRALEFLDASHNNFTGEIPTFLEVIPLKNLNISFNNLEGQVSRKGVFANASSVSILGNSRLCGGVPELQLPKCRSNKKKNKLSLAVILVISFGSVLLFVVMALFFACYPWKKKVEDGPQKTASWEYLSQVSYNTLYNATNGFSTENLIGEGSFSSVYKGNLDTDGANIVAIKVLNLHHRGGSKSFISECEALRNTRHRNLAKVITCCSGIDFQGNDFKAIVYEFMPNGSVDRWLHNPQSELHQLSLIQRVCIVLDVAYALDYLHHHAGTTIVHCDLKPSNILLDEDMVAHVGDFGLSKILQSEYQHRYNSSSAGVRGTIGYAAPEYGVGSIVSRNADMYSFGIMLLEMMTRKKPTDVMFGEELSLHSYAEKAMGDGALEIVDPVLLKDDKTIGPTTNKEETTGYMNHERCLRLLLEIGVSCSMESPQHRMDTASVIQKLQLIKNAILGNSTL
ncbi:putative protein kinase RLK-Pelle-LRR-XII-1 family [Helianthus debilis subsp. tardiflorus]